MKSSLGKLRKFAFHKSDLKETSDYEPTKHVDELAQATQDMQDMRCCYDSLLSAAAATANSAFEFSESLREMGTCLQEKTALNNDAKTGRALLMLGKVQLELQKLVDSYRSHIFQTITTPSESLLNELRTVEEMKRQCDEKRSVYEYMMEKQREKGRSKSGKVDTFNAQQLHAAHIEYDEEATLCVFRLKSLKQGQSRSLLTQAARHHAAQLNFFRKGLKSLEAVEPHLKMATEQQRIDYQFVGLEDDIGEVEQYDIGENDHGTNDGELSFDYRENKLGLDVISASRNSMEVEDSRVSFHQASMAVDADVCMVNSEKTHVDFQEFSQKPKTSSSHSAPIFAEKKFDPAERVRQMQPLSRKFHAYVLPTPLDAKSSLPTRTSYSGPCTQNLWHSSPILDPNWREKISKDENFLGQTIPRRQYILQERSSKSSAIQLPPPLTENVCLPKLDTQNVPGSKKMKRQAFSGPIAGKSSSLKPVVLSSELPQLVSGPLSRVPIQISSSPKVSPSASPPPLPSPIISELHELPRPPGSSTTAKSHVVYKSLELPATGHSSVVSNIASPLPTPRLTVQRSFSIPSRSLRAKDIQGSQITRTSSEDVSSPLLIPLKTVKSASTVYEDATLATQL